MTQLSQRSTDPSGRFLGAAFVAFAALRLGPASAAAQVVQRPSTVWGDVPVEQEGLTLGGVEILTGLLVSLLVLGLLAGVILARAWGLLRRSGRAEGFEAELLWRGTQKVQKWASWIAFGLLPTVGTATLLLAPDRKIFGFGIPEMAFGLFLLGSFVVGAAFLVLEAARRALGAERA